NKFCGDGLIGLRYAVLATILYVQSLEKVPTADCPQQTRALTPGGREVLSQSDLSRTWRYRLIKG
ncbi:hypothetical protein, partial [Pseudomonas helleri]|uniref:hypothetical protein n=1 Tax=Pseudomonas helleri TaxID=1608996 RepID=UPI001E370416